MLRIGLSIWFKRYAVTTVTACTTSYWTSSKNVRNKATVATIEKKEEAKKKLSPTRDPQAELVSDQDQLWRRMGSSEEMIEVISKKVATMFVKNQKIFKRLAKTSSRVNSITFTMSSTSVSIDDQAHDTEIESDKIYRFYAVTTDGKREEYTDVMTAIEA
jgi:hypothetical protein